MWRAWVLAAGLVAASAGAQTSAGAAGEVSTQAPGKRLDTLALPLLAYTSDTGLTYGAVGGLYLYAPGYTPYRHGLGVQVLFTTRGLQSHFLRYDGPRLLGPLRVEARLEYRRERLSPFYGPGNLAAPEFAGNETDERFNYVRGSPSAWVRLRGRPWGERHPLESYVGYQWRFTEVDPYADSLLAEQRPLGVVGGATGQLFAGVLWDTRDEEADPGIGGMEEVALRLSASPTGSRYTYGGLTLVERRFWRLGPRFVLAQRLALDVLFGEVPFFEWPLTGGLSALEGVGGMSTVRGLERNRFVGNVKAFSNTELRFRALEFPVLGAPVRAGAVAFVDLGRVWHPQVADGPWWRWHPGLGLGLRLSRQAAVARLDWAWSPESGRQRFYINLGHMF